MTTLGPYQLLEPLGEGGMGVVYRARHQGSGQEVALKTVRVPHESLLRGIRREIQALARLRHPGVVRILEEGLAQGIPWYAMELLSGQSLRRWREGLGEPSPDLEAREDSRAPSRTQSATLPPEEPTGDGA